MDHTAPLGQAVEGLRTAAGLSQNSAADLAGIARTTYKRNVKTGDFTYPQLRRIAAAFGVSTKALVDAAEDAA
jgi:transcriptional regulator with XRE-family HTH domain